LLHLRFERQPVAGLDLDRANAFRDQRIEPREALRRQLLFGSRLFGEMASFTAHREIAPEEVALLMKLFRNALEREVDELHASGVRLKVVGDTRRFDPKLRKLIERGEELTAQNRRVTLTIAANYGGRWDILQAMSRLLKDKPSLEQLDEELLAPYLAMSYAPEPDLFIRTGGEQRISNFLLWQIAYSELYFTDTLWPDFDAAALDAAIASFRGRERRFGRTSEQLEQSQRPEVA